MNPVWIGGNAVAIVSALICMSYLAYVSRELEPRRFPVFTVVLIAVTAGRRRLLERGIRAHRGALWLLVART